MSTVTVQIKGGLGNQLFCYATGRAMALRTNRSLQLDLKSGFSHDNYERSYRLSQFPLEATSAPESSCYGGDIKSWRHKLARNFNKLLPLNRRYYIPEKIISSADDLIQLKPSSHDVYLTGYWQHEDFFGDQAEALQKELHPPTPSGPYALSIAKEIGQKNAVFIHVRQTRYAHRLEKNYYRAAIQLIRDQVDQAHFFVFGDDLEWAKTQLPLDAGSFTLVEHHDNDELADLWLMSQCSHAIIANSSFSWWGAWLISASEKIVIHPEHTGYPVNNCRSWISIPNELIED